ncbi:unnamed protein product, partial [Adineta ricciae]
DYTSLKGPHLYAEYQLKSDWTVGAVPSSVLYMPRRRGFYCSTALYFDAGDESNENTIDTVGYDPSCAYMVTLSNKNQVSDHYPDLIISFVLEREQSWNPSTGETKVILRGIH